MRICLYGLGEAGALFAADLVAAGVEVQAYDPAETATPTGVTRYVHPALAARKVDAVLAAVAQADARLALLQAIEAIPSGAVYADLSTSAPALKRELAGLADAQGLRYADVALLSMVPGHGLAVPSLAAGAGASRYAELINDAGGRVDVIDGAAGGASARKLLRSVMMKGTAAVLVEALQAGAAADDLEWLWSTLTTEIEQADGSWLHRLATGSERHARRRLDEMRSALALLEGLGVTAPMTTATIGTLRALADAESTVPRLPGEGEPGETERVDVGAPSDDHPGTDPVVRPGPGPAYAAPAAETEAGAHADPDVDADPDAGADADPDAGADADLDADADPDAGADADPDADPDPDAGADADPGADADAETIAEIDDTGRPPKTVAD